MAYMHIDNLYKDQTILMFKECYALEKVHGTSAHISYNNDNIHLFSGGAKHDEFVKLFDVDTLLACFRQHYLPTDHVTIFGEAYGGRLHKMSSTYGDVLQFIVFEIKINDYWCNVPRAHYIANTLFLLEFVPYIKISTDILEIDAARDTDSIVAVRRGCGIGKIREGVVLRPLIEFTLPGGGRIIAKHKRPEFAEVKTPRNVGEKLKIEADCVKIADEWVTYRRLEHIADRNNLEIRIENIGKFIPLMTEDVYREAQGEIVTSKELEKYIGRATALLVKQTANNLLIGVSTTNGNNS